MHRFFVKKEIPDSGIFILESEAIAHQLSRVLKIKRGEDVVFFNGGGFDVVTKIDKISSRYVSGKITRRIQNSKDPSCEVHLYSALIKKDKFDWVLEKGTELGVKFFHPLLSERSVKTGVNLDRALRVVKEATEQSGQDRIPEVLESMKFPDAVDRAPEGETRILFDPNGEPLSLKKEDMKRVHVFIGPEGGFSEKEREYAKNHGFSIASLAPRILRSETAAVLATGLILTL
ncbi:MAG: hypothetical protein A2934_04625 [Candidatus Sungbacteria bacterium RIFCSPLOWO2_01_FULL_47_10]|uniref:Ribosomal RNA small subunit methyltransferase E n=1 Tax=Candidatus Sungbacteria bacterium RIFCSPLOWO2_01_FULL_47_10 TaxID=1802276 RepID=A0A1G2L4Q7_9BACT|nr:MAG: hypothetical protein A2934_04625 [Candidatus Sungbacteria bacterium RIFCSPLOWO2_01_FULL_47_10]